MSDACKLLHEILEQFPKVKYPFDVKKLPKNGIYFFYEDTELWGHDEMDNFRISTESNLRDPLHHKHS